MYFRTYNNEQMTFIMEELPWLNTVPIPTHSPSHPDLKWQDVFTTVVAH